MFSEKTVSSKLILPILVILLFSIAGCGNKPTNTGNPSAGSTSQAPASSAAQNAKSSSPAPTVAGAVTYDNYLKIKLDSTYDDVKSILGEGKKEELSADTVIYKWNDQGKSITIQILKGKIEAKSQYLLGKTTANLTEDQFKKITTGMTIDQVISILGPDYQEVSDSKRSGNVTSRLVAWIMADSKNIKVRFQDDKVTKADNYLKK